MQSIGGKIATPMDVVPSLIPSQRSVSMPKHIDSHRWCLKESISMNCFCKQNARASGFSRRLDGNNFGISINNPQSMAAFFSGGVAGGAVGFMGGEVGC